MPNASAEHRRSRRRLHLGAAVLLSVPVALGTAGCQQDAPRTPPAVVVPPAVDQAVAAALRERATAVRDQDEVAFLAGVDTTAPRFRRLQQRLFTNLQELPLQRYQIIPGAVAAQADGSVVAEAEILMQLRGYDRLPVRTPARFTFREADGGWLLVDDHDRAWEVDHDIDPQPWDVTRIEAEESGGVLGLFDPRSIDDAYHVMEAVTEGIADIGGRVPLAWNRRVVVYALSDTTVMAALDDLPGGDPERLEGVAFSVPTAPGDGRLAGIRFMLHPRMVGADGPQRDRLIRHELVHVALGVRDDRVPTWLVEGLAEFLSVQAVPPAEREIARQALEAAERGLTAMPADAGFNGPQSGANYGLAWFACELIARRYGVEALWELFDAMRRGGGTPEAEQDAVLEEVLGIDSRELARYAGRLIVRTFG